MSAARVTVLHAAGKVLTKTYARGSKGRIVKRDYDSAALFHSSVRELATFTELANLLRELERRPDHCIIRAAPGRFHPGAGRLVQRRVYAALELVDDRGRLQKHDREPSRARWQEREIAGGRLRPVTVLPAFEEQPTSWLLLDFDGVAAPAGVDWRSDLAWTAAFLRLRLPPEFGQARCCYYATASAADLSKPELGGNAIRMRLAFLLARGVTSAQAKRWLAGVDGLDPCTLNPAQPIYTAAPLFRDGLTDPLPERLGVLDGNLDRVPVPELHVDQRFQREAFAGLGPAKSAEGLGLVEPHPRLDAALARLAAQAGATGAVRSGLLACAFAYIADAGRNHVDIEALTELLTGIGEQYRSAAEVAGYGLDNLISWCLERAPEEPEDRPHYPARGLPPDEATARLRQEMEAAIGASVGWHLAQDGAPAPVFGFKAGAGVGKSGTALEFISAIPGVENMNIEIYVPDHRLATEMAGRAATAAPGLRVQIIRGRGQRDADGKWMCKKRGLARRAGRAAISVSEHMCRSKTEICSEHTTCRHPAQFADRGPAIRILAHACMFTPRSKALPDPDLIMVDESFWRTAVRHSKLALDRLGEASRWHPKVWGRRLPNNATAAEQAFARAKAHKEAADRKQDAEVFAHRVRSAFEDGRDPRTVVTAEECDLVAALEWESRGGPRITPGMAYRAQYAAWKRWKGDECGVAGKFWSLLAEEHQHPGRPIQRIVSQPNAKTKGGPRHLLRLHYRRALTLPAVPTILLDADLDPAITGKFFAGVQLVEIPVRQQATIIQITDRTCSMRNLLGAEDNAVDQRRAGQRRGELERFAARELAGGGLLIGYKALVPQLTLPAGVDTATLGKLRGSDAFKHHDVAAIAGRLEPSVEKLERLTRAMFGDDGVALQTIAPDQDGRRRYDRELRRYRLAGGKAGKAVAVSAHPDRRAQLLLEQIRELEIGQGVARLRLVHDRGPGREATVYLLTNLPLDLEIAELTTWGTLMRDRDADACARWGGVWLRSAAERSRCAPDLWPNAQSAENGWRRRKKGVSNRYRDISIEHFDTPFSGAGPVTLVEYRRAGQRGSPHRALLPGEVLDAAAARVTLEAITGAVAIVIVVRTIHWAPVEDEGEGEPPIVPFPDEGLRIVPLPAESWAISGNVGVQRTVSTDGRTAITSTVRKVGRAGDRGPEARAGP